MRTALLPTPGDPFMLAYWLRNFETWRSHIDELVVLVNGPGANDASVRPMIEAAGGHVFATDNRIGHDGAMRWLLENGGTGDWSAAANLVLLCEDDAYVRHPGAVGEAFRRIEAGEVGIVGSPRHEDYFTSPLQEWPRELGTPEEEVRRGLWPAFLFARRSDLLDTDRVYGDRAWRLGETLPGLDAKVTPELCASVGIAPDYIHLDTLFGTTFQLRAKAPRIELVHHVRLFDAKATEEWIAEDPPWFHVTGLSTLDYVLDGRTDIPDRGLWERRIAWWLRSGVFGLDDRADKLQAFVVRAGIDGDEVNRWLRRFDAWVTWDERVAVPA